MLEPTHSQKLDYLKQKFNWIVINEKKTGQTCNTISFDGWLTRGGVGEGRDTSATFAFLLFDFLPSFFLQHAQVWSQLFLGFLHFIMVLCTIVQGCWPLLYHKKCFVNHPAYSTPSIMSLFNCTMGVILSLSLNFIFILPFFLWYIWSLTLWICCLKKFALLPENFFF